MSSIPEPVPDPPDVRARDEAVTSSLVAMFTGAREGKAALDALEIRALAAAAALVDEQRSRLTSRASLKTDLPVRTMVAELALAARVSERTIQRQLDEAADLCARFAPVVDALGEGRISKAHVGVIHDAGHPIDDDDARAAYVHAALARAESMTAGRLRPVVEILAARLNPRTIQQRHADAREERAVRVRDAADGMADLIATAPAVLVHGIYDRLTQLAHAVVTARPAECDLVDADADDAADDARDGRTIDQLRADILSDLLLTATGDTCSTGDGLDAIHATVQISIPVLTAAGQGAEPAVLAGCGPIDPVTARRLLAGAPGWERVLTSPLTGAVLAVDRYRPNRAMRRHLRARDERCLLSLSKGPWLPATRLAVRPGPHRRRRSGRTHRLRQPRASVPTPPHPETPHRVARCGSCPAASSSGRVPPGGCTSTSPSPR